MPFAANKNAKSSAESVSGTYDLFHNTVLLDHVSETVIVTDLQGRVIFWNRGAELGFGYTNAEMQGQSVECLYSRPSDERVAHDLVALEKMGEFRGQWRGRHKNGSEIIAEVHITTLKRDHELIGFIGVGVDVTEKVRLRALQERHTEQLRRLADASLAINSAVGIQNILREITEKARGIIGAHQALALIYVPENTAAAAHTLSVVSLSDKWIACRDGTDPFCCLNTPGGLHDDVCRSNRTLRLTQDELKAHPRWRSSELTGHACIDLRGWLAVPLIDRQGKNLGCVQVSDRYDGEFSQSDQDILMQLAQLASVALENAALLDMLNKEKVRAEEANRSKDEFMAMLGHELRNPLAPILTALELIALRGDDDRSAHEHGIIARQVRHMVQLVDDLLDVSRLTSGKILLSKSRLEIATVIARAVEMTSPLLEQRGHKLTVQVPSYGLLIDGDENRLSQVFANLLSNAAKYTPPGGDINIRGARVGDAIEVEVIDSGMGIGADLLPHVFELFIQGRRTLERAEGGLGLGLSIVRALTEMHSGTVRACSQGRGLGSQFTVSLPAAKSAGLPLVPESKWVAKVVREGAKKGNMHVLVVDDNRDAATVLAEALEYVGYAVKMAFDGPQALQAANQFEPDVVILDIGLPVIDGYEVARRMRQNVQLAHTKLIALTGYGQEGDRARSRELGFAEHLVKPIDMNSVISVLKRLS